MTKELMVQQIVDLLIEAGQAHHQAYIETDGADSEWPLWYADYLQDKLNATLNAVLTKSEIVYLLVMLDKHIAQQSPETPWPRYYAEYLVENHA